MKKHLLRAAAIFAILALPLTAFALQPIGESQMAAVDGQAGVSIAIDNVKLYQHFDRITWTDTDADGGSINLMNVTMDNFTIDALTSAADVTASTGVTDASGFVAQALDIDVLNTLPALSAGATYNASLLGGTTNIAVAGVQIKLPTLVIKRNISIGDITVSAAGIDANGLTANGALVANNNASFGSLELAGAQLAILGGTLEIAPH